MLRRPGRGLGDFDLLASWHWHFSSLKEEESFSDSRAGPEVFHGVSSCCSGSPRSCGMAMWGAGELNGRLASRVSEGVPLCLSVENVVIDRLEML